METATDNNITNSTKRIRFNLDTTTSTSTQGNMVTITEVLPPKGNAENHIKTIVASLHPNFAPIAERLGKEHIILLSKLDNKIKAKKRLDDDLDLIPRSARIQFNISVSKRTEQAPGFTTLKEEVDKTITDFHKQLRSHIITGIGLEIKSLTNEIKEHLVKSIRVIVKSFMIVNKDKSNADIKVNSLVRKYIDALTVNAKMNINEFNELYKSVNGLDAYPITVQHDVDADMDHSDSLVLTGGISGHTHQYQDSRNIKRDIDTIFDIVENVFVSSWACLKQQEEKNQVVLELKKLSTVTFTERATADAVFAVDNEPSADKPELQALIRKETRNDTKDLRQQLEKIKNELNALKTAKNTQTGGRGGAPATKTKQPTTSTKSRAIPPFSKDLKTSTQLTPRKNSGKGNQKVGRSSNALNSEKKNSKQGSGTKQYGEKKSNLQKKKNGPSSTLNQK